VGHTSPFRDSPGHSGQVVTLKDDERREWFCAKVIVQISLQI